MLINFQIDLMKNDFMVISGAYILSSSMGVMLFFRQIFIQGIDQSVHFSCPVFGQRVDLNDLASDLFGYGFGIIDIELTLDKRSYGYFFQGQIDDFFQMGRIGFFPFVFDRDLFHPVIGSKISQSRMIDQKYFVFL